MDSLKHQHTTSVSQSWEFDCLAQAQTPCRTVGNGTRSLFRRTSLYRDPHGSLIPLPSEELKSPPDPASDSRRIGFWNHVRIGKHACLHPPTRPLNSYTSFAGTSMVGKYQIMGASSHNASGTYPPQDLEKSVTLAPISLSWSDISFAAKGRPVPILSNVNGEISSGRLLAVMGPSGAGKSTFLDVLCRRATALTGEVRFLGASFGSRC